MIQKVLASFPHVELTSLALFLFMTLFFGVIYWLFRKGSNKFYHDLSNQPLELKEGGKNE